MIFILMYNDTYRAEVLQRYKNKLENGDIMVDYIVMFPTNREKLRFLKNYKQGTILTVDEDVVDDCYCYWIAATTQIKIHGILFEDPPF